MITDEATLTLEPMGPEIAEFYARAGLGRATIPGDGIGWTFQGTERPFCAARVGGRIEGLSAYIERQFRFGGGGDGRGAQAVDSFVSERLRGQGMFTRLARTYHEDAVARGLDLVWGFPNSNAAPAWFGKLGWTDHGDVPFLVRPLRAGYVMRKLSLTFDFPLGRGGDQGLAPLTEIGSWADEVWDRFAVAIGCSAVRDAAALRRRLIEGPLATEYRVVADPSETGALVATREAHKHGGQIAYLMEAMGGPSLRGLLRSETARLRDRGCELVLAWAFPWSPNYSALRREGFLPLPRRLRPVRIGFGGRACTVPGKVALDKKAWYLSYFDSDTV